MAKFTRSKAVAVTAAALGVCALAAAPALADGAPAAGDVTLSGSDTLQYGANFFADGDTLGNPGYNFGKTNKVFSFDATADASGRQSYANNDASSAIFAPTAVYRAGTGPVLRVNGSGNGANSLYQAPYTGLTAGVYDPNKVQLVNAARMSSLPSCATNTAATNAGTGGLHVYKSGTEVTAMAVRSNSAGGTNAPASLTRNDVLKIYTGVYTTWGQVPGYSGGAPGATIRPLLIQAGSGTRATFDAQMTAENGGTAPTYSNPNIEIVQENDYAGVLNSSSPANAIDFFSGARIGLNNSGYFGASAQNQVVQIGGFTVTRNLYFVVRQADLNSTTTWQPGSTKNFVRELFAGPASALGSNIFQANLQSAGFNVAYQDLGNPGQQGVNCT